jgi:Tol biopolymer transport system component
VVFASFRSQKTINIWSIDITGGNPHQITHGTLDHYPTCSPDGQWLVYYNASESGSAKPWRVSLDGSGATQLFDKGIDSRPIISPDGKLVAFSYPQGDATNFQVKLVVIPATGGAPLHEFELAHNYSSSFRFTSDSQGITYPLRDGQGVENIWEQPLSGGAPHQITDFKTLQVFDHAWSRDGKQLAISRGKVTRDVVLLTDSSQP